jgi:hypothetical protein
MRINNASPEPGQTEAEPTRGGLSRSASPLPLFWPGAGGGGARAFQACALRRSGRSRAPPSSLGVSGAQLLRQSFRRENNREFAAPGCISSAGPFGSRVGVVLRQHTSATQHVVNRESSSGVWRFVDA